MAFSLLLAGTAFTEAGAQEAGFTPRGVLRGTVVDGTTEAPLEGVRVQLQADGRDVLTNSLGAFRFEDVPVGTHVLAMDRLGYGTSFEGDIIVKSGRVTEVRVSLSTMALEIAGVTATVGHFRPREDQPVSRAEFVPEEIRRAPGSAGDVSRIVMGLPSVAKVDDQSNGLVVRGGSPIENGFFIDNIPVPNINHFPTQGSSGGPIGLLNVELIQEVEFYSGGFGAEFGDRLSSVMDIELREGTRSSLQTQVDLNITGIGALAEGPLGQAGSWVFSARRSYLDLIVNAIDTNDQAVPEYSDLQGNVTLDLSRNHRLRGLALWGDDNIVLSRESAIENDEVVYGGQSGRTGTYGINWRALWSDDVVSNTSVSHTASQFGSTFTELTSDQELLDKDSNEKALTIRNVTRGRFGGGSLVTAGVEAVFTSADYDTDFGDFTDALGNPVPGVAITEDFSESRLSGFASVSVPLNSRVTATLGARLDRSSVTEKTAVSPRGSLRFAVSPRTSLSFSAGLYQQELPLLLLSQSPPARNLRSPRALHGVVGLEHVLSDDTRFTLEAYHKSYDRFPRDPSQPGLFVIDEVRYRYGLFFNHEQLLDDGEARSTGIEAMLQKKLARDFYGQVSGAISRSQYKNESGTWVDRVYDNRWVASAEGGYKPGSGWEVSARWILAGGPPFTPLDVAASASLGRDVLDGDQINQSRFPSYQSLNVRFDKHHYFRGTNVTWYVSAWNVYNRENVSGYYWSPEDGAVAASHQWGLLPVIGLEIEF